MRSARKDGTGTLKLALTHKHKTVYQSLGIKVKPEEWDRDRMQVVLRPDRKLCNVMVRKRLGDAEEALWRLSSRSDYNRLSAREILDILMRSTDTADRAEDGDYLMPVYNEYITLCRKSTTAALYRSSLNNLLEYEPEIDTLRFRDINVAWLRKYQQWLLDTKGMGVNGANVYLRNLRTVFNYASQNELTAARYPFRNIDMSTSEPSKKLIPYEKFLEWATYPVDDQRTMFRDLWLLSFYLCGIRAVDLLHLRRENIEDDRLVYSPEKLNGKTRLSIKVEPEAWEIIRKYEGKTYLLNIMDSRLDYREFCKGWNKGLKFIGPDKDVRKQGRGNYHYTKKTHTMLIPYITTYYARTCFASYSYNLLDTPMDVISQALGHKSGLKVTNFYVKRDSAKVDEMNRTLIDRITGDMDDFRNGRYKG